MNRIEIDVVTGEQRTVDITQEEQDQAAIKNIESQRLSRISQIKERLAMIDADSVRAIRAKTVGKGKPQDEAKLSALDLEADSLRIELGTLQV